MSSLEQKLSLIYFFPGGYAGLKLSLCPWANCDSTIIGMSDWRVQGWGDLPHFNFCRSVN